MAACVCIYMCVGSVWNDIKPAFSLATYSKVMSVDLTIALVRHNSSLNSLSWYSCPDPEYTLYLTVNLRMRKLLLEFNIYKLLFPGFTHE